MRKKIFLSVIFTLLMTIGLYSGLSYADNVFIDADKQNFDGQNNLTTFEGNVKVVSNDITVKSPKASVKMGPDGKAQEAVFVQGAHAVKDTGMTKDEVKANIIKLSLLENKINAEGNVKSWVIQDKKTVVTIKADTQDFDMTTNLMNAEGNVIINYNDMESHSDKAKINIDQAGKLQKVNLIGAAQVVQGNNLVNASNFLFNPVTNELVAIGNTFSQTTLEDGTKVSVWSDYQQYDRVSDTLMTSGSVRISYMNYIATGPKASFVKEGQSAKPNKILFYGRSKIQEGTRIVEANKITITLDPKNFVAEGNVKTKFTQVQGLNKGPKKDANSKKGSAKKDKKEKVTDKSDITVKPAKNAVELKDNQKQTGQQVQNISETSTNKDVKTKTESGK